MSHWSPFCPPPLSPQHARESTPLFGSTSSRPGPRSPPVADYEELYDDEAGHALTHTLAQGGGGGREVPHLQVRLHS